MADADSGMGSHREGRQERRRAPRQPGATGREEQPASPEQAENEARHPQQP
jgi:hypothetical protein